MDTNSRSGIVLLILGLLVVAAAGYMLFAKGDSAPGVTVDGEPGSEAETAFLNLTAEIDSIRFDTEVFEDPRFAALVDIRTTIVPETSGRPDPFAPLSGLAAPKR